MLARACRLSVRSHARRASSTSSSAAEAAYDKRLSYAAAGLVGVCAVQTLADLLFGGESHAPPEEKKRTPPREAAKAPPEVVKHAALASTPPSDSVVLSAPAIHTVEPIEQAPFTPQKNEAAAEAAKSDGAAAAENPVVGPMVSTADGRLTAYSDGQHLWLRSAQSNFKCQLAAGKASAVGFTQPEDSPAWLVYKTGDSVLAVQPEEPAAPVLLSPDFGGAGGLVGQVFLGKEEVLMELDAPGFPRGLYRQTVPPTDGSWPALDVPPPAVSGEPVQWVADSGKPLCVRAVVLRDGSTCSLHTRKEAVARVGNEKWTSTCLRLGLPLPPVDPNAPPIFSSWERVFEWDASEPMEVLGFHGDAVCVRSTSDLRSFLVGGGERPGNM